MEQWRKFFVLRILTLNDVYKSEQERNKKVPVAAVENSHKSASLGHGGDARDAKRCTLCALGDDDWSGPGSGMVCCEGCAKWFHLHCLNLKVTEVPDGNWWCWDCRRAG